MDLNISDIARQYIIGVCKEQIKSKFNLSDNSIVINFAKAKESLSFIEFQQTADWISWMMIWFPEGVEQKSLALTIAQNSYFWCYRLTGRRMHVFEELADTCPSVVKQLNQQKTEIINFLKNSAVLFSIL